MSALRELSFKVLGVVCVRDDVWANPLYWTAVNLGEAVDRLKALADSLAAGGVWMVHSPNHPTVTKYY